MKKIKLQNPKLLNENSSLQKVLKTKVKDNTISQEEKVFSKRNIVISSPVYKDIFSKKMLPPLIKTWFNGVYNFNKSLIKNLPSADNIVHKLIKSYFFMNPLWQNVERNTQNISSIGKKRSRLLVRRLRRASLNRIAVSKPEIKHSSDKVFINLYIFNKKKNTYLYKLNNIYNNTVQALAPAMKSNFTTKRENFFKPITLAVKSASLTTTGNNNISLENLNIKGKSYPVFYNNKVGLSSSNPSYILSLASARRALKSLEKGQVQKYNMSNFKSLKTTSNADSIINSNIFNSTLKVSEKQNLNDTSSYALPFETKQNIDVKNNNFQPFILSYKNYNTLHSYIIRTKKGIPHTLHVLSYGLKKSYLGQPGFSIQALKYKTKLFSASCTLAIDSLLNIKNKGLNLTPNMAKVQNLNTNNYKGQGSHSVSVKPLNAFYKGGINLNRFLLTEKNRRLALNMSNSTFDVLVDKVNSLSHEEFKPSSNIKEKSEKGTLEIQPKENNISLKNKAFKTTLSLNVYETLELYNKYKYRIFKYIQPEFANYSSLEHETKQTQEKFVPWTNKSNLEVVALCTAYNLLSKYKLLHNYNKISFALKNNALLDNTNKRENTLVLNSLPHAFSCAGIDSILTEKDNTKLLNKSYNAKSLFNGNRYLAQSRLNYIKSLIFKFNEKNQKNILSSSTCDTLLKARFIFSARSVKNLIAKNSKSLAFKSNKVGLNNSVKPLSLVNSPTQIKTSHNILAPFYKGLSNNLSNHKFLNYNLDKLHTQTLNGERETAFGFDNKSNISLNTLNEYTYMSNAFNKLDKFFDKYLAKGLGALTLNSLPTEGNLKSEINSKLTILRSSYKKKIISQILNLETSYIHYLTLLEFNNSLFKNWFINPLSNIISRIYNKKVIFNVVSLKAMYFNSDILSNLIAIRLNNHKKNRYNKVFKKVLRAVALAKVNEHSYNSQSETYKSLNKHYQRYNDLNHVIGLMPNNKIKSISLPITNKSNLSINTKNYTGTVKATALYKRLNDSLVNTINFIKHKSVFGIRLEASGRLTKRSTASRKIFKFRYLGNLRLNDTITRKTPGVMVKDKITNNLQFSKISSKTRNGAFGIKGWINQA